MLNQGLRSEENQRINSIIQKLIALVFVPEDWKESDLEAELNKVGLTLDELEQLEGNALAAHLLKLHFEWADMEQFADILVESAKKENYGFFKAQAKAIYLYIQAESKAFSFDIMNKVNRL